MLKRKRAVVVATAAIVVLLALAGGAWAAGLFPDVADNDTHSAAIDWAAQNGIVRGYQNGNFGPYDEILRGQAATMFKNYDDYLKANASGTSTCSDCHDHTTLIVSKEAQFDRSLHGTGTSYLRGEAAACAGCHGSEGPEARIEAGLPPHHPSVQGVVNVSPMNCRTCHDIHTTYTAADWSLTGDARPVLMAKTGGTFDGGAGNLCANCHQIRNDLPVAVDGNVDLGNDTRFGTHYGPEAQMMLGEGGVGVDGSPGVHYQIIGDTCVTCHMGDESNHTFDAAVSRCQTCHAGATNFDINGVQTEIEGLLQEVHDLLVASGIMNDAGRSIPGVYPEDVAAAMWNYKLVEYDGSKGVHNADFAKALLEQALEALQ
jgi:hypothetical protein